VAGLNERETRRLDGKQSRLLQIISSHRIC
jgi:hypothetical protein